MVLPAGKALDHDEAFMRTQKAKSQRSACNDGMPVQIQHLIYIKFTNLFFFTVIATACVPRAKHTGWSEATRQSALYDCQFVGAEAGIFCRLALPT